MTARATSHYELPARSPLNWTFHPQIICRPGRLRLLDELIAATVADSSVWVARADEVASAAALNQADPERAR
jgi:hypothetical protein